MGERPQTAGVDTAVVEAIAEALLQHYGSLLYRSDAHVMAQIAHRAAAPLIAAAERERIADAILNSCDHSGSFQPPGTDEAWACDECRDAASIARGEPS